MLARMTQDAEAIYIACGVTDFRMQITGLVSLVQSKFSLNPYSPASVYLFCNRKRDAIKALRYDQNGFALLTKKLMGDLRYQWPRTAAEIKKINHQQIRWLTEGLEIEPKKVHKPLFITEENTCF